MPRTTDTDLIEQLLNIKAFPMHLFEFEIKCQGTASLVTGFKMSDTDKSWVTDEWVDDSSVYTDQDGNTFTVDSNTLNTITLNAVPTAGEYTLNRWLYFTSEVDGYTGYTGSNMDYSATFPGGYTVISYGGKSYRPYPIKYTTAHDHEIGEFPTVNFEVYNPGKEYFNFYSAFERFNGFKGSRIKVFTIFVDENGDVVPGVGVKLEDLYFVNSSDVSDELISFTTQSLGNLADKKLPPRIFTKNTCGWVFRDTKCKYTNETGMRPSGVSLTTCSKNIKTILYKDLVLEFVSSDLTGELFNIKYFTDTLVEDSLIGCLLLSQSEHYLFEIVDNGTDWLIVDSYSRCTVLSSLTSVEGLISDIVIIDKNSCYGHNTTGRVSNTSWTVTSAEYSEKDLHRLSPTNLLINGNFNNDKLDRDWTVSTDDDTDAYIIPEDRRFGVLHNYSAAGGISIDQDIINTNTNTCTGQIYDVLIRYYAYDIDGATNSYFFYIFNCTVNGTVYYWHGSTKSWLTSAQWIASTGNRIVCRTEDYSLGTVSGEFTKKLKYIRMDTYVCRVPFVFPNAYRGKVTSGNFSIHNGYSAGKSLVVLDVVGVYKFVQSMHFGGFPGIPAKNYWLL